MDNMVTTCPEGLDADTRQVFETMMVSLSERRVTPTVDNLIMETVACRNWIVNNLPDADCDRWAPAYARLVSRLRNMDFPPHL